MLHHPIQGSGHQPERLLHGFSLYTQCVADCRIVLQAEARRTHKTPSPPRRVLRLSTLLLRHSTAGMRLRPSESLGKSRVLLAIMTLETRSEAAPSVVGVSLFSYTFCCRIPTRYRITCVSSNAALAKTEAAFSEDEREECLTTSLFEPSFGNTEVRQRFLNTMMHWYRGVRTLLPKALRTDGRGRKSDTESHTL
jgi:hypothetical protein